MAMDEPDTATLTFPLPRKKKMGRPRMPVGTAHRRVTALRLSDAEHKEIFDAWLRYPNKCSFSAWMRRALLDAARRGMT